MRSSTADGLSAAKLREEDRIRKGAPKREMRPTFFSVTVLKRTAGRQVLEQFPARRFAVQSTARLGDVLFGLNRLRIVLRVQSSGPALGATLDRI
jgi:hypothetical protein